MNWNNQLTKTPYLVLFMILISVGVGTASALITITLAGDVEIEGFLDMTGDKIKNVGTPTASNDAASKSYVDSREIFFETFSVIDSEPGGQGTSIALTSDDMPVISYTANALTELRIAICENTLCSNKIIRTLDTLDNEAPDLVLASGDIPVITYRDDNLEVLKLIRCGDNICRFGNSITTIEPPGDDVGFRHSLALIGGSIPVMAYLDATNESLKITKCVDTTCVSSSKTITTIGPALTDGPTDVSLNLDSNGNPVVAFVGSSNELRVLTCGNDTCTSGQSNVAIGIEFDDIGSSISLSIAAGDIPVISYSTSPDRELHFVKCGNKSCTSFIEPVTIVDLGKVDSISMDLAIGDLPIISYEGNNGELMLAICHDAFCNTKTTRVLDSLTGEVEDTGIKLTSEDFPIIAYGDFDTDYVQKLFTFHKGIILD